MHIYQIFYVLKHNTPICITIYYAQCWQIEFPLKTKNGLVRVIHYNNRYYKKMCLLITIIFCTLKDAIVKSFKMTKSHLSSETQMALVASRHIDKNDRKQF